MDSEHIALIRPIVQEFKKVLPKPVSGPPAMPKDRDLSLMGFTDESLEQTAITELLCLKAAWDKPTNNKSKKDKYQDSKK